MPDRVRHVRLLWAHLAGVDALGSRVGLLARQMAEQEGRAGHLMRELAAFDDEVAEFTAALHAYEAEMDVRR